MATKDNMKGRANQISNASGKGSIGKNLVGKLFWDIIDSMAMSGETGGSTVSITPTYSEGTKIADYTINGTANSLFVPSGGGGGASLTDVWNSLKENNSNNKIDFSHMPTMYWANLAVSNSSNSNTEPTFKSITIGNIKIDTANNAVRVNGNLYTTGGNAALGPSSNTDGKFYFDNTHYLYFSDGKLMFNDGGTAREVAFK